MATTVRLVAVRQDANGVEVEFSDGSALEFSSLNEIQGWAQGPDRSIELTRQLCIAYLIARSPDMSNTASVRNKDFTFDLSAPSPIRVQ